MIKSLALLAALAIAIFLSPTGKAEACSVATGGPTPICSKSFAFTATCGTQNYPGAAFSDVALYINPWETGSITIVAVHITATLQNSTPTLLQLAQFFLGNSFNPDPMTGVVNLFNPDATMTAGEVDSPTFPIGEGMEFPAWVSGNQGAAPVNDSTDESNPRLDLHTGGCSPTGMTYSGFVVVWYTEP